MSSYKLEALLWKKKSSSVFYFAWQSHASGLLLVIRLSTWHWNKTDRCWETWHFLSLWFAFRHHLTGVTQWFSRIVFSINTARSLTVEWAQAMMMQYNVYFEERISLHNDTRSLQCWTTSLLNCHIWVRKCWLISYNSAALPYR